MLKKENRADRKAIAKIFKNGRFINSPSLTFKFILDSNLSTPVISCVVPKSVYKSAVKRNALRRRGYLILEKYFNKLPRNIVGVFVFNKKISDPNINLENEIKNILSKIN
jgi:ribonuclease P protein component